MKIVDYDFMKWEHDNNNAYLTVVIDESEEMDYWEEYESKVHNSNVDLLNL